jgi:hypothetical protein
MVSPGTALFSADDSWLAVETCTTEPPDGAELLGLGLGLELGLEPGDDEAEDDADWEGDWDTDVDGDDGVAEAEDDGALLAPDDELPVPPPAVRLKSSASYVPSAYQPWTYTDTDVVEAPVVKLTDSWLQLAADGVQASE